MPKGCIFYSARVVACAARAVHRFSLEGLSHEPRRNLELRMHKPMISILRRHKTLLRHAKHCKPVGPDQNGGAAGSTNASFCRACPAGSYLNASGSTVNHESITINVFDLISSVAAHTVQGRVTPGHTILIKKGLSFVGTHIFRWVKRISGKQIQRLYRSHDFIC